MSINLTDEIEVKTKKGKLGAAKQIFLEGDTQTVENEIQDINSRHNDLSSKHESLSSTVSEHTNQIESNQSQITANKSAQDEKNASLDANMAKLNTRDNQITELVRGITATGGASVATAVTYDNTSSQLTSATVQGAVDELQGSKINKTSISQESGDAEDKVMSQKAVKTELRKKVNTINESESKLIDNSDGFYFTDAVGNVIAKILSDGLHVIALYDKDGNKIDITDVSIESIKNKLKQDGFYFTDAVGNVIAKITKDGLQAIKILDKDGNEIESTNILGDDNTIPVVFSNKLIATSVKPHSLFGKYIYSIGDSHTYAYMEKLSKLTGAIYDPTIHHNILLENEKLPGVHTMCTQAHAMVNWFKAGNPIDAIFIENVHHLFNDGIEVQPYENNVLYDGGSFSTYAEMQEKMGGEYFDNLLAENLPTPNGAFVVSVVTSVQRVQFAFSSGDVCTGGSVSLKFEDVSGETYSASITVDSGMTLAEVVNKINTIQFDEFFQVWGNPKHHQDLGGKTYIDFQYTGNTDSDNKNRKILINTDDTTANIIISSNTDASTSFNYYYCFWSRDVSKWSDKSYWHYQSGGTFTTDSMKYYKGMVEILQKNIPNCKLYIWTCPDIAVDWNTYTTSDDKIEMTFEDGSIDIAKWKSSKKGAEDIKRAKGFNELAEYYNIPCLNIQDLWGVNVLNGKYFYKNNDVHLSGGEYSGYDRVAELLASLTH